jgi:geranylgeranyl reductase family protein
MRILIVGAGPIGCYLARLLRLRNKSAKVTVIEEHPSSGLPLHCSGLVGGSIFKEARLGLPREAVINHIDEAQFFLNGDSFHIRKKQVAFVLDRKKFDQELSRGLAVNYNTRFVGLEKENGHYLALSEKEAMPADVIIGADGSNSSLRKIINPENNIKSYCGAQMRVKTKGLKAHTVRVYLRKPFFAWVIPESGTVARVGLIGQNPHHELNAFLQEINLEGEVLENFGGFLPLGLCRTQKDNIALVGDAACQVKPLTHGGIYYGIRCAEILAGCLQHNRLADYEAYWQGQFGREIEIGLKMKRLYQDLDEESFKKFFKLLKVNRLLIERFANFDRHADIILKLLRLGKVQRLLGKLLLRLI